MPIDNLDRLAKGLNPTNRRVKSPTLERRQGTVTAVATDGTVSVALGGDPTSIPGVPTAANYIPSIGDNVHVDVNGKSMMVMDRIGDYGPSVFLPVRGSNIITNETMSASGYGNLTTAGPSVSVTVSSSGMLLVQVSANITTLAATDGGLMSFAVSGATTLAAQDLNAIHYFPSQNAAQMAASKVSLLSGLTPGATTITAKYRALNALAGAKFSNRTIWALPL